jgi:hypothetical protein
VKSLPVHNDECGDLMNDFPLHKLIGHKVAEFSYERECMGVILQNGSALTIYNQMSVQDARSRGDLSVAGASVSSVHEDSNLVCIEFDNGISWLIDLSDDAYSGPEAMQLNVVGYPIVIWRIGEG